MVRPTVHIVGGGFSGLSLGYYLAARNFKIFIYERKQWGGLIQTRTLPSMLVETAANAFMNSELLEELALTIGCDLKRPLSFAKRRYIFKKSLRQWPLGFWGSLVFVFGILLLYFRKSAKPQRFETISQWVCRLWNQEVLDYLISPALQGIYGGDPERLSAHLIFKAIFKKRSHVRRGSVAPEKGMADFIQKLKNYLQFRGVQFFSEEVSSQKIDQWLQKKDIVIIATAADDMQKLLQDRAPVRNTEMIPLIRVTLGWEKPEAQIKGFGVLFPQKENFNTLGVLSNSFIFSHRGRFYNESWILGGALHSEVSQLSDDELLQRIYKDRERILHSQQTCDSVDITRWPKALTHYTIELEEKLSSMQSLPDLYMTGNYLGALGLSQILEYNWSLSEKILKERG